MWEVRDLSQVRMDLLMQTVTIALLKASSQEELNKVIAFSAHEYMIK